jgi:hypothetical protein
VVGVTVPHQKRSCGGEDVRRDGKERKKELKRGSGMVLKDFEYG